MLPTVRRAYRNPFEELQREIDSVFNRAWMQPGNGSGGSEWQTAAYPVDIHETEDSFVVSAELPGFKREEIDVTLEQGVLTISAERQAEESKGQPHLQERRYTRVTRSFRLGQAVDEGRVNAQLEDGVLKLTLPKREEVKPRRIEVK